LIPDPHADLDLVRRALQRDRNGLQELASRLRCVPRLLAVRNARLGGAFRPEELADLSQDVLLIVWRKLKEYRGFSALDGWLYRISRYEYMNALRRLPGRTDSLDELALDPSQESNPWEFEDVHRGLERIGDKEAEIIRLKHFEDLTFEEIGARLGISPNTAKARYYRGLRALAPLLEERGASAR
jgi:RNA polymerase sigma-70 factor (ECF subfamily)